MRRRLPPESVVDPSGVPVELQRCFATDWLTSQEIKRALAGGDRLEWVVHAWGIWKATRRDWEQQHGRHLPDCTFAPTWTRSPND